MDQDELNQHGLVHTNSRAGPKQVPPSAIALAGTVRKQEHMHTFIRPQGARIRSICGKGRLKSKYREMRALPDIEANRVMISRWEVPTNLTDRKTISTQQSVISRCVFPTRPRKFPKEVGPKGTEPFV